MNPDERQVVCSQEQVDPQWLLANMQNLRGKTNIRRTQRTQNLLNHPKCFHIVLDKESVIYSE
jgi:hypothetical protein